MELAAWQQKPWQILMNAKQQNRLPHALLLIGDDLKAFAEQFAYYLLCQNGSACGQCHSCQLLSAESHPDFIMIEPEEPGQMIKIDQIRPVVECANTTTLLGGFRMLVIQPADAMNIAAQNALLKTLEEPTPNTVLMLLSNQNTRLLKTIVSRCQRIVFHKPELRMDSPLRQEFYQGLTDLIAKKIDPLKWAGEMAPHDLISIFKCLLSWLQDCVRLRIVGPNTELINDDFAASIRSFHLNQERLFAYSDRVRERFAKIIHLQNLNRQLLLEELLIEWINCHVPC